MQLELATLPTTDATALVTALVYLLICFALRVPEVTALVRRLPGFRPQSSERE